MKGCGLCKWMPVQMKAVCKYWPVPLMACANSSPFPMHKLLSWGTSPPPGTSCSLWAGCPPSMSCPPGWNVPVDTPLYLWVDIWGNHYISMDHCLEPLFHWWIALLGHHCICWLPFRATNAFVDCFPRPPLHLWMALKGQHCIWIALRDHSWIALELLFRMALQDHPTAFTNNSLCKWQPGTFNCYW